MCTIYGFKVSICSLIVLHTKMEMLENLYFLDFKGINICFVVQFGKLFEVVIVLLIREKRFSDLIVGETLYLSFVNIRNYTCIFCIFIV